MRKIGIAAVHAAVAIAALACSDPAGPPATAHIETVQGPPAVGAPGLRLRDTLSVRLVDDAGKPVPDRTVSWTVRTGGGSINAVSPTTDQAGIARAVWRLGTTPGPNEAEARTLEDSVVVFQSEGRAFQVTQLDANYGLGCGLAAGDLWCWGQDAGGTPDSTPSLSDNPDMPDFSGPVLVARGLGLTSIAVGSAVVCGVDTAHALQCLSWTANLDIPALPALRAIFGGDGNTFCGLAASDSTAYCWDVRAATGAQIPSSPAFVDLAWEQNLSNGVNGCGRLADSTAMCWGEEMLGDSSFGSSAMPVAVYGGHKFAEIGVGVNYACGRQANGEVWCWGRNDVGQLGGPGPDSPVPVLAASGISLLSVGRQTVLAVQSGSLLRWGRFGTSSNNGPTPFAGAPALPVGSLAPGATSCLRYADGGVYCFEELWTSSSTLDWDVYAPVMPAD